MFEELPDELLHHIASFDEDAWVSLVVYVPRFTSYAYSDRGQRDFIQLFTKYVCGISVLFNRWHSIYDKPVIPLVPGDNTLYWYYCDRIHRDGDKPAEIGSSFIKWLKYGEYHRESGPAIIMDRSNHYYLDGKKYMSIYHDGSVDLFINGKWTSEKITIQVGINYYTLEDTLVQYNY